MNVCYNDLVTVPILATGRREFIWTSYSHS